VWSEREGKAKRIIRRFRRGVRSYQGLSIGEGVGQRDMGGGGGEMKVSGERKEE